MWVWVTGFLLVVGDLGQLYLKQIARPGNDDDEPFELLIAVEYIFFSCRIITLLSIGDIIEDGQ